MFEDDVLLTQIQAQKKLERMMQKMRLESCLKALKKLTETEDNDILSNALEFYEKNKFLTPKYAFVVLWRLRRHKIDHNSSFFKVNLKRSKYKDDLRNMEIGRVHIIWPALTSAQRKQAIRMGHLPPSRI